MEGAEKGGAQSKVPSNRCDQAVLNTGARQTWTAALLLFIIMVPDPNDCAFCEHAHFAVLLARAAREDQSFS